MDARYRIIKPLGFGGYGNVFLAKDTSKEREVVIKFLRNVSSENRRRFEREARIYYQQSDNQFVVNLLDYDLNSVRPYLILEYCKYGSLRNWVNQRHNWYDVGAVLQHAALGLDGIHKQNGFHRDIKPDNLLISQNENGQLIIKVGDFGSGRVPFPFTKTNMTRSLLGTEGYIAPELYNGYPCTQKADIYSLGITGIELLTGSVDRESITNVWIPNDIKVLLLAMTSYIPDERPDAQGVTNTICAILKNYDYKVTIGLSICALVAVGLLARAK